MPTFDDCIIALNSAPVFQGRFWSIISVHSGWETRSFPIRYATTGDAEKDEWLALWLVPLGPDADGKKQDGFDLMEQCARRGNKIAQRALNGLLATPGAGSSNEYSQGLSIRNDDGSVSHVRWK